MARVTFTRFMEERLARIPCTATRARRRRYPLPTASGLSSSASSLSGGIPAAMAFSSAQIRSIRGPGRPSLVHGCSEVTGTRSHTRWICSKICRRIRACPRDRRVWDALAFQISLDMKCEACSIFVFDDESGNLALKGSTGLVGNPAYEVVKYKVGEGLTGLAFKRQTPIIYYRELVEKYREHHISKFRERLRTSDKSRSILVQAIVQEDGDAIGVIRCNNKNQSPRDNCGRFSEEDIGVVQMIGVVLSERLKE